MWVAVGKMNLKVGDLVSFSRGLPMKNFPSKSLNRTFDIIYFVSKVTVGGPAARAAQKTIAELYAEKKALAGKEVTIKGEVVRYRANHLDHNWIDLEDGTGEGKTKQVTIKTPDSAKKGETVTVRGLISVGKTYGKTKYGLLIEDADVSRE